MLYITLRQYEYIVAVADAKSLTQAAAALNVSQPSLSVAITRVEQRLKQPLFARGKGTSIRITPFGHTIVERARQILALASDTEIRPVTTPRIVLGCFEDIAPWHLASRLAQLKSACPEVEFMGREGRFSDLARDLAAGKTDIAISYDIGFPDSFQRRVIETVLPVAFLSTDHPLAQKPSVTLEELIPFPIILFSEHLSENFVLDVFARLNLSPKISQKVTSLEMMRSLAAHGAGVGISYSRPPSTTSYDGQPLVTVPVTTPRAAADLKFIWSDLRQTDPVFNAVLTALQGRDPSPDPRPSA